MPRSSVPKDVAEHRTKDLGDLATVVTRLGAPGHRAHELLPSERSLSAWIHEAVIDSTDQRDPRDERLSPPCDAHDFETYLNHCSLSALLNFAREHALADECELHGRTLTIRIENTSCVLGESRALRYLRSLIRAYAMDTGKRPWS